MEGMSKNAIITIQLLHQRNNTDNELLLINIKLLKQLMTFPQITKLKSIRVNYV